MTDYDQIRLIGIGGYGYHGVLESERREGQPFHADVVLHVDTAEAARTDALDRTVDYAAVARAVVEVIEGEPANLVETVAGRIADVALSFGAAKVEVTLHKPQAPVGVPFSDVQVSITRTSPSGASTVPAADVTTADPELAPALPELPAPAPPAPAVPVAPAPPVPAAASLPPVLAPTLLGDNEGVPESAARAGNGALTATPEEPVNIVLGIGGNLGDVRQTLREAVSDLDKTPGIEVSEVSALARTAPVTHDDAVAQNDYLNAVVLARTTLSPRDLLDAIHSIEDAHGRVRVQRWGDRTLDIDIITYGDVLSDEPDLSLPHPRAAQRAFVLVPWAQVQPDAQIPGEDGGAVAELAETAPDRGGVRWLALDWLEERSEVTSVAPPMRDLPEPPPAGGEAAVAHERADEPEPAPANEPEPSQDPEPAPAPPLEASPAAPAAPLGEPPTVAQWLAQEQGEEPEYADVEPVLPVAQPAPAASEQTSAEQQEQPGDSQPAAPGDPSAAGSDDKPLKDRPQEAAPVDWLAEEPPAPPLDAKPQWSKVIREE